MKIAILSPEGVQSLDVVGPAEVFWQAARRLGDPDAYQIEIMGVSDEPNPGHRSLAFSHRTAPSTTRTNRSTPC